MIGGWLQRGCGTLAEFWDARPCEVAAALGIGVYAPEAATAPRSGKFPHPRDQTELLRQRVLASRGLGPKPEPIRGTPALAGLTGALQ